MDTARYEAHIEEVCDEREIYVFWVKQGRTRTSLPSEDCVWIGRCHTEREYLIALHEIGHVVRRDIRWRHTPSEVIHDQEAGAWEWAFVNARWPVSQAVREYAATCLRSYGLGQVRAAAVAGVRFLSGSAYAAERRRQAGLAG